MTEPLINISDSLIPPQNSPGVALAVDLNEILQAVCNRYIIEQGKDFILRFENLPLVQGSEQVFQKLFDSIASMVLNHPPYKSKLFLYVACKEQIEDEIMDLRLTDAIRLYKIDFYSNIITDQQWIEQYGSTLNECDLIARQSSGSFTFFPICNTGCLFSISLPGKIK